MEFCKQEYWSGLTFPSPGGLPDPEIEPGSPAFQADSLSSDPPGKPLILLFRLEWWDKNNIINRYNKLSSTTISFFFLLQITFKAFLPPPWVLYIVYPSSALYVDFLPQSIGKVRVS